MTAILLFALRLLAPSPVLAQVDLGAGLGPDAFLRAPQSQQQAPPAVTPLGLALSLSFDATTWAAIEVSSAPARVLSEMLRQGYYKLELLQMVLMARRGAGTFKQVQQERGKGRRLREIAESKQVDFDAVYEESLALDARLTARLLPSVLEVRTSPPR